MTAIEISLRPLKHRRWMTYAFALAAVCLATLIRVPFKPWIGDACPFFFYLPFVVLVAAGFGAGPGLVTTAASILAANYFWMPPEHRFSIDWVQALQITAFLVAGGGASWLGGAFHEQKQFREHLRATLATAGDAIVSTDCSGTILYVNAMAEVLTEMRGEEVIGRTMGSAFDLLGESGQSPLNASFQSALVNDEIETLPRHIVLVSKSGRRHCLEQKVSRILDSGGRKLGTVILFHRQA